MAANSHAVSVRIAPSSAGQTAHDLRLGPQPEYVNADLSYLNRTLISPLTNEALRDEWRDVKERVGKGGKIRSNQNLGYAGIVTFGSEAQKIFEQLSIKQQDAAFLEVGQKIADRFKTELTGMVSHLDETALHAHFQLRGIADDGSMLSQSVKRGALREVQDIAAEVMGRHAKGIERGKGKWQRMEEGEDYAATVNRSVKRLHDDLPAEIIAKEAKLAKAKAKLKTNLVRLAKARKQASEEGDRAKKAAKNAALYEGRADTARETIADLNATLDNLHQVKSKLEVDNSILSGVLAQKKTKVTSLREKKASLITRLQTLNAA